MKLIQAFKDCIRFCSRAYEVSRCTRGVNLKVPTYLVLSWDPIGMYSTYVYISAMCHRENQTELTLYPHLKGR